MTIVHAYSKFLPESFFNNMDNSNVRFVLLYDQIFIQIIFVQSFEELFVHLCLQHFVKAAFNFLSNFVSNYVSNSLSNSVSNSVFNTLSKLLLTLSYFCQVLFK